MNTVKTLHNITHCIWSYS